MFLFRIFRIKNFVLTVFAVGTCLLLALGVRVTNCVRLHNIEGERTFYLDSVSSQGLMRSEISARDLSRIVGESVRFDLADESETEVLARIQEEYGAKVLFVERAGGVSSYYCHTDEWENGIILNGELVNLHIAVSETQCSVGTPIIFGGF